MEILELTDEEDLSQIEKAIEKQMSQEEIIKRLKIQYDELESEEDEEEGEEEDETNMKNRLDSIIEEVDEEATEY